MAGDAATCGLARALSAGRRCVALGVAGSSAAFTAAAIRQVTGRSVVLVSAHIDDADEASDELEGIDVPVVRLPALEVLPGETSVSLELYAARLGAVRAVGDLVGVGAGAGGRDKSAVLLCPVQALMQGVPEPGRVADLLRRVKRGDTLDPSDLVRWLDGAGYTRVEAVEEPGDFAVRGGIVDVFAPGPDGTLPVRLDFFGDEVDRIAEIDLDTMGSDRTLEGVDLVPATLDAISADNARAGLVNFLELLPDGTLALLVETGEVVEQARGYYERVSDGRGLYGPPAVLKMLGERAHAVCELNQFSSASSAGDERVELPVELLPGFARDAQEAVGEVAALAAGGRRVVVACSNDGEAARLGELRKEFGGDGAERVERETAYVHRGFVYGEGDDALVVVPYHELLHRYGTRRKSRKMRGARASDAFLDVKVGDYVVHAEHGIAKFAGLTMMKPKKLVGGQSGGEAEEYLTLEFAGSSRLHVSAMQIDQVQRYIGGFSGAPPLSTVGGVKWKKQKEKVAESVRELAAEMLRVRAAREALPGVRYPADTKWQTEFEAEFPHEETEDQLASLAEIKRDLQGERPMDRLLCGDVGFGKTELAIRAAFKTVEFGKQVAVLVPTTVLAEQHERTFAERFRDYPFKVESLSRFKTTKEINNVLAAVRKGAVDVIVGTHRLLSKDVRFSDLGLVVVDEEQRFGVEHKERLLQLRATVDVLTLSATPIPRTLHMAMLGLRDISSLTTPPSDRRAIVTEVMPYSEKRIGQAIARELARDGQVFFVHNRVHNIKSVADEVQKMAPGARIAIGHGQMGAGELEDVMLRFMRREIDVLVSTTIIESGIDNPHANTMIIRDGHRFGLSELHQLRGRVGRGKHRAYCYLLLPEKPLSEVARKRLGAIEEYSMLGAGFKIAMRDLEIRGAGNLLGSEQSGHIAAVGYDMYCRLLDEAVHDLRNERVTRPSATRVQIGVTGVIPKAYVPSDARRLEAYRRIAEAGSGAELARVREDLNTAYGEPPAAVERLLDLAEVRVGASALGIRTITVRRPDVGMRCDGPGRVEAAFKGAAGTVTALEPKSLRSDKPAAGRGVPSAESQWEVYWRPPEKYLEGASLVAVLRKRLSVGVESVA